MTSSRAFNSSESEDLPLCYKPNKHRHMRIADILLQDDGDDYDFGDSASMDGAKGWRGTGCRGLEYSSPRRFIGRWLKRLREKRALVGSGKTEKGKEVKERSEFGDGSVPMRCSTNCPTGECALSPEFKESNDGSGPSGSSRKDTSFNLGLGFSMLYLLATSKNELNKMMELRTQMENFLQMAQEELQRKDALSKLFESNDNVAYSTTDIPEGSNSNSNLSAQSSTTSYSLPESKTILVDQSFECDMPKPEYSAEGMNQLEEELEAELERLQLHLDTETLSEHPQLQRIKVNAPERSHSASSGEVIDPQDQEADTEEHYDGVPPYLLERKLHELLEARQQEHIEELEGALECLQHKLQEKELELSWWKDTAKLISQHIPGTSRLTSQHGPETFRLLLR